jgi:antitoxin HigA-1
MTTEQKLAPMHPGDVLLHDFMEPLGLSAYRVAKDIGVEPIVISQIVHHKRAVTARTALLLGKYLGTSPELWLGLQSDYDLERATTRYSSLVDTVSKVLDVLEPKKRRLVSGPARANKRLGQHDEKAVQVTRQVITKRRDTPRRLADHE